MDGLSRCLGGPVPFVFERRMGLLRPLTLARLGFCESYLMGQRLNPMDAVEDAVSSIDMHRSVRTAMLRQSYDDVKADKTLRYISRGQMGTWLNEPQGMAFTAWLCLGKSFPTFRTLESSRTYFLHCTQRFALDFRRTRERASGTDLLSVLEWPGDDSSTPIKYRPTPWKKIFRVLGENEHFGPRDIGRLTMWNLRVYLAEEDTLGGTKKVNVADMNINRPHAKNSH